MYSTGPAGSPFEETLMTTNRRKPSNNNGERDALELLHAEHVELLEMFGKLCDADTRHHRTAEKKLAAAACRALRQHSQIEWEFFYPALRTASGTHDDLLDAARIEQALVRSRSGLASRSG
jgi:hypothetical protein